MPAFHEDIIKWTLEGIDRGASDMLIVQNIFHKGYVPRWVMPGESIETMRSRLTDDEIIEDGINLVIARDYFNDLLFLKR